MSHLAKIELEIKDLSALEKACKRLNIQFMRDQQVFKWYASKPSTCAHAIKIPGASYEVGVINNEGKYELQADFYDRGVGKAIGTNGGLLKQAYTIEKAKMECIRKGYSVREQRTPKGIELRVEVR